MIKSLYKTLIPEKQRINLRLSIQKAISPLYYGKSYRCNCCGKSFRKFLDKGNVTRKNVRCPRCDSLERNRLLLFYLENETDIFLKSLKVFHVAPESCLYQKLHNLELEYIDGDIDPAYASHVIDITQIPYPDNYFDLVICSHVLGHIPDERKAIDELHRVLSKKGQALIMTLINKELEKTYENHSIKTPDERLKHYGEVDLCRLHGTDFAERLAVPGFTVEIIDYRKQLSEEIVNKYRLGDGSRELIFKCTKQFI